MTEVLLATAAQLVSMSTGQLVTLGVGLLGGTGVVGAIAMFIKAPKEAGRIVIDSAQGAVVVQSGVIKDLNQQLARKDQQVAALETKLDRAQHQIVELEYKREQDRRRIAQLEQQLQALRTEVHEGRNGT